MKKIALVTGASRGIGAAIAVKLAKNGYDVAINYRANAEKAAKVKAQIEALGRNCILVPSDVSKKEEVQKMFAAIKQNLGPVDLLVCNAGIAKQAQIQDVTEEMWHQFFSVNVDGVYYCVQEALPYMLKEHAGNIITISSMWGLKGASCESAYAATKAAIIGFSKSLANELGPSGIRVNCVAPGVIDTDMMDEYSSEVKNELAEETPVGRLGTPEDVANVVGFLASDESSFVTGQVISCDGGFIV